MKRKQMLSLLSLVVMSTSAISEECKYNVKKTDRGYHLVKECLKNEQPDLKKTKPIEVDHYRVLRNFDNLGTEEIRNDDLYGEKIFNLDGKEQTNKNEEVVAPKDQKDDTKKEVKEEDQVSPEDSKFSVPGESLSQFLEKNGMKLKESDSKDPNSKKEEIEVVLLEKSSPSNKVLDSTKKEEPSKEAEASKKNYFDRLLGKLSSKIKDKKRVDFSTGYYILNSHDLSTGGELKAHGVSNRLDYSYILNSNEWFTEFTFRIDSIAIDSKTNFQLLSKKDALIGGKVKTGKTIGDSKVGGSISRTQIAAMGRFGRDPRKDVVLTSIANTGISGFYEYSFEKLFECKFELTYLSGGENEHFKMDSGSIINFEASKEFYRDLEKSFRGGVVFEGTSYRTEGVDNKDSRFMAKISMEW